MKYLFAASVGGGLIFGGIMWSFLGNEEILKAHLDPAIITDENLIWTDGF